MKTIKDTGWLLHRVETNNEGKNPAIGKDKIRVRVVRYATYEYPLAEFGDTKGSFTIHDANCEEARMIAELVKLNVCPTCNGTGTVGATELFECPQCKGRKLI